MTNDIEKYKESVRAMAESNSSLIFPNDGREHACIVATQIIKKAKKSINIFTRSMSGAFSSNEIYLDAVREFLTNRKDSVFNIIVTDGGMLSQKQSDFINKIGKEFYDRMNIMQVPINIKTSKFHYFMTGDDEMFRIQLDMDYKAIVCFNNEETTSKLNTMFNLLNSKSSRISL